MGSCLVITNISGYSRTVTDIIKDLNRSCIYVSFNKVPKYTKRLLMKHNIDNIELKFISCVSVADEGIVIDPGDLNELTIALEKLMKEMKGDFFVLVDTISAFTAYHSINTILRFVGSINSILEKHDSEIIWVTIEDESEKELNEKVGPLCDKVLSWRQI